MTAPSMADMNKEIEEKVIKRTLEEIKLKSGKPALTLYGSHTHLHINPSGKFIIGGPQGDAGLTGRKRLGSGESAGGSLRSIHLPTDGPGLRVDSVWCSQAARSSEFAACGFSDFARILPAETRRLVVEPRQLSYAIGVAKPLSLFVGSPGVEAYGSEKGQLTVDDITNVLKIEFDCRPGAIAASLALREPKYQETAAYCHFGREAVTKMLGGRGFGTHFLYFIGSTYSSLEPFEVVSGRPCLGFRAPIFPPIWKAGLHFPITKNLHDSLTSVSQDQRKYVNNIR
ncbi:unnamed protein product [Cladocopium goreaui]|uniref:S-adenosylmethionine synthase (AdoMet synthase) (MAT) (Methionine adenosyltransferase) n=1 Tax=Cladocopium goreaui TaxID=2562237 RepID=A0A9P1CYK6_9DINO|nr:unnamed protein product [Cladocopium goreaui]